MTLRPVARFRLIILMTLLLPASLEAQTLSEDTTRIRRYKEEAVGLVKFFQFTLNTLGDPRTPAREKDIIIQDSYQKIFLNPKVQIEDDLVPDRSVVTNKDVQAYLKDVDFFFKTASFEFNDIQVEHRVNESGKLFFQVSLQRYLLGVTIDEDTTRNTQRRYIEINLDEENRVLKIASIYTTRLGEEDMLVEWWDALEPYWKQKWGSKIRVNDSVTLASVYEKRPWISLRDSLLVPRQSPDSVKRIREGVEQVGDLSVFTDNAHADVFPEQAASDSAFERIPILSAGLIQELRHLVNQRTLDFSNDPDLEDLSPLSMFSELRSLNIAGTDVFDLTPLRNLTYLEVLDCSNTQVRNLEPLRYATQLRELLLAHTRITTDVSLSRFTNLRVLDLSGNNLIALNETGQLSQLRDLSLNHTMIREIGPLAGLNKLERLSLSGSWVSNLTPIQNLRDLSLLYLEDSPVRDLAPLSGCQSLRQVFLDKTEVRSLMPLVDLPDLTRIYCDSTLVGQREVQEFASRRPEVLVVYNSELLNSWWGKMPGTWQEILRSAAGVDAFRVGREELQQIANVKELNVSGNQQIQSLQPLEILSNLKSLDCSYTTITSLEPIRDLNDLEYLNCAFTSVGSLEPLNGMSRLVKLDVSNTDLNSLDGIQGAANLREVKADSIQVEWLLPLDSLPRLTVVSLEGAPVSEIEMNRFLNSHENVLVLFQQQALMEWWAGLSPAWQQAFTGFASLSTNPSSESLHRLTQLASISFSDNPGLANLGPLSKFRKLRHLKLEGSMVRDLSPLASSEVLETLILSRNPVTNLVPLAGIHSLVHLQLDNTLVEDLDPLGTLLNLRILSCKGTGIKKLNPLSTMIHLQQLDISNTEVRSLSPIESLRELTLVECYNTKISERRLEKFQEERPGVEVVYY